MKTDSGGAAGNGLTLSLVSSEFDGPITGKSREKVDSLSLKLFLSPSFSNFSHFPLPNRLGEDRGQVECPVTCHMSNSHWLLRLHLIPYPSTIDFHPITCCHMGPHLSSCLTHSAHDTWYLLSHF